MGFFHEYIPNLANEWNKRIAKSNSMFCRIHLRVTFIAISRNLKNEFKKG